MQRYDDETRDANAYNDNTAERRAELSCKRGQQFVWVSFYFGFVPVSEFVVTDTQSNQT